MSHDTFRPADILLPDYSAMQHWSVIACDQFSSQRDYWERVKKNVGDNPSTLNMILPEVYLSEHTRAEKVRDIAAVMDRYISNGIFREIPDSFVYIERTLSGGAVRRGLVGAADLEQYEFTGGPAPILASEDTLEDRLPARVKIRRASKLELPHVMAFIDDIGNTVIEPLSEIKEQLPVLYDFDLCEGGGHIKGYRVSGTNAVRVQDALRRLRENDGAFMIIGDGNHSLAAAKVYWNELKRSLGADTILEHPARFGLLEINNIYDPAVCFEAIHRVVFGARPTKLLAKLTGALPPGDDYTVRWLAGTQSGQLGISASCIGEMLAALQDVLDDYSDETGCVIDYIHGEDAVTKLSDAPDRLGLILPAVRKTDFFKTVSTRGVFPKKSFSVGCARDKRYYIECRRINTI